MMFRLNVPTKRGVVLNGVLFRKEEQKTADTVMIAITGIHGNFYSNPFYYNIGETLNEAGIDFIYAQTNVTFARQEEYKHIILAGHSLGANKVIYYLSRHQDVNIDHFFLLSPANLTYMMSGVTDKEKRLICKQVDNGDGNKMLPFPFMGWVECIANTAWDWQFSGLLNNVHTARNGNFSRQKELCTPVHCW